MVLAGKLPACERCRKSKVKCDTAVPKCSTCTKGNTACVVVDLTTGLRYSRLQLHDMHKRLELLESQQPSELEQSRSPKRLRSGRQTNSTTYFVGEGSGLDMFQRVSANVRSTESQPEILEYLDVQSPMSNILTTGHELPQADLARTLLDRYFLHSHLHHPLLSRQSMAQSFGAVYGEDPSSSSPEDFYRIFMVSAISSITLYRTGNIVQHPYGFFRSAQRFASQVPMVGGIRAIQNLLLIARFAMYYHIDCSIWDIVRLCMRQCVELGLHQKPAKRLQALEEQTQRNVFWDCYIQDRYSSGILGRPFAIAEQDIGVDLPLEVSEMDILGSSCYTLDEIDLSTLSMPNESSVFIFVIRLRRISARILNRFFSSRSSTTPHFRSLANAGRIQLDLDHLAMELEACRASAPQFSDPKSLYQRSQWHNFLVDKDKISLIRGAISHLPSIGLNPPQKLLSMCLECATRVIELYIDMFAKGHITWTRSYFQILFTSGLSIMYSMSILKPNAENTELVHLVGRGSSALSACTDLLLRFVSEMPDAERFAMVFKALTKQYLPQGQSVNRLTPGQPLSQDDNPHHATIYDTLDAGVLQANINPAPSSALNIEQEIYATDLSTFEFDFGGFEDWPLDLANTDNILGRMEAGLGEYAWGAQMGNFF